MNRNTVLIIYNFAGCFISKHHTINTGSTQRTRRVLGAILFIIGCFQCRLGHSDLPLWRVHQQAVECIHRLWHGARAQSISVDLHDALPHQRNQFLFDPGLGAAAFREGSDAQVGGDSTGSFPEVRHL